MQRGIHRGFLGSLFILVDSKCLLEASMIVLTKILYAILGDLADDKLSGVTVLSISSFHSTRRFWLNF